MMNTPIAPIAIAPQIEDQSSVAAVLSESRWYAIYTSAHHEKRVAEQLTERHVESFLPTYSCIRRWKDRHKRLELPLFPSYVFVRLPLADRLKVLVLPGVVRLVGYGGPPVALPDAEMNTMRTRLAVSLDARPHPYLTAGRRVRMRSGPLEGLEGVLLRRRSRLRLVVSVHLLQRSVVVDVDEADVAPLPAATPPQKLIFSTHLKTSRGTA